MSCPPQPIDRDNIELLSQCLPLMKDPELMALVAHIVCTGVLPDEDTALQMGKHVCDTWLGRNRRPLRYCRPGHAWEVERSVSYYVERIFLYALRRHPARDVSSHEVYWSYLHYEDRQQRLNLSQNP